MPLRERFFLLPRFVWIGEPAAPGENMPGRRPVV